MARVADAAVESRLRAELARAPDEVLAVYLFGSRGRGSAGTESDVDLGFFLAHLPEPRLDGVAETLADELEAQLGLEVDAVILNSAAPDLIHRVLRDGLLRRNRRHTLRRITYGES